MRWAEYVARMGREDERIQCFGGEASMKDRLDHIGVDEVIILKWILRK
jgi:hypothetical protein